MQLQFASGLKPRDQRAESVWKISFVNFNRVSDSSFFNGKLILEPVSARPGAWDFSGEIKEAACAH